MLGKQSNINLENIYPYDEKTNTYTIELSLRDYNDLFNGWDASPVKRRDIDPELLDYLEEACYHIPSRSNIEIQYTVNKENKDEEKEKRSLESFEYNFLMTEHFINKLIKHNIRKGLIYFILSATFVTLAYTLTSSENVNLLFSVFVEGLFIGGWVMLWEVFRLIVFDGYELRIRKKRLKRLSSAKINFNYKKL